MYNSKNFKFTTKEEKKASQMSGMYNPVTLFEGTTMRQFHKALKELTDGTEVKTIDLTECEVWRLNYIDEKRDLVNFSIFPSCDENNLLKLVDKIQDRYIPMDVFRKAGAEGMIQEIAEEGNKFKTVLVNFGGESDEPEYIFFAPAAQQSWNDCMPMKDITSTNVSALALADSIARNADNATGEERNLMTMYFMVRRANNSNVYRCLNIWKTARKSMVFDYEAVEKAVDALEEFGTIRLAEGFAFVNSGSYFSISFEEDEQSGVYPIYELTFSDTTGKFTFQEGYNNPEKQQIDWDDTSKCKFTDDAFEFTRLIRNARRAVATR